MLHRHPANCTRAPAEHGVHVSWALHHWKIDLASAEALVPDVVPPQLDLSTHPMLAEIGQQPIDLAVYDYLLRDGQHVH